MTQTTFTDNVVVQGSRDIDQLKVQGNATQLQPLQTWETSSGGVLSQVTGDGRLQVGDDVGLASPDALVEAHRAETSTAKPKRGWHSLGKVTNLVSDLVTWTMAELLLLGSAGVSGLQTAFRAKLTHNNTGSSTNADLRAGDFQSINQTGSSGTRVGQVTGVRGTGSNDVNAFITKAVGVEATITNASGGDVTDAVGFEVAAPTNSGTISNLYGVRVPDLTPAAVNYAIKTGLGRVSFGDFMEVKRPGSVPGTPATDFMRIYPKSDGKVYAKNWSGTEYDLTGSGGAVSPATCNGRLTLTTLEPITVGDVTTATILYFTPYMGDKIALYDGAAWKLDTFSEISIELTDPQTGTTTNGSAVVTGLTDTSQLIVGMEVSGTGIPGGATISSINSATQVTLSANATASGTVPVTFKIPAGKNVDVFCFDNSGTPKLEFGPLWTNNTARATTLTPQSGVLIKTGTPTRRYIGTVRTTSVAGQTECSFGGIGSTPKWFVWNAYHRKRVGLKVAEATNSWTYTTAAWRQMNNSAVNQIELLLGLSEEAVRAISIVEFVTSSAAPRTGIALDVINATHSFLMGSSGAVNTLNCATAIYEKYLIAGYHYLAAVEYGGTGVSFRGDNNVPELIQSGLMGEFWA